MLLARLARTAVAKAGREGAVRRRAASLPQLLLAPCCSRALATQPPHADKPAPLKQQPPPQPDTHTQAAQAVGDTHNAAAATPAAAVTAAAPASAPSSPPPSAPAAAATPAAASIPKGIPVVDPDTLAAAAAVATPPSSGAAESNGATADPNAAAAAAAAAAAGLPPPVTAVEEPVVQQEAPPQPKITKSLPSKSDTTAHDDAATGAPAQSHPSTVLSQSPPAGFPLPLPRTHLLWMANGTQCSIEELFYSPPAPPAATGTPAPTPAAPTSTTPAAKDGAADASSPAAPAVPPAASPSPPAPAPRPRTVLVVGFVGAFLSLCQTQLPPFSARWPDFRARGVDSILGVSVNDHAVLKSFAQQAELDLTRIGLIADHDGAFVRACNLALDLSAAGMGLRARRFVLLVREGFVEEAWVEDNPGELTVSSAESVLQRMPVIPELAAAAAKKKKKAAAAASPSPASASPSGSPASAATSAFSAASASPAHSVGHGVGAAASKVVAAVQHAAQRTVAAVSDRLDGTTDASDAVGLKQQQERQEEQAEEAKVAHKEAQTAAAAAANEAADATTGAADKIVAPAQAPAEVEDTTPSSEDTRPPGQA